MGLVISCEHGGNRLPSDYRRHLDTHKDLLQSHRGFDPGALCMARSLAEAFTAPLIASVISRLLVDLNRSIGHRELHLSAIPRSPAQIRQDIVKRYYLPYRRRAASLVDAAITAHGCATHISAHSFTPELHGRVRQADIGLLYDPARPGEVELCRRWQAALAVCAPHLVVRRNYPYAGRNDGLTRWFRRRHSAESYIGVELELNQQRCAGPANEWWALRAVVIQSLRQALAHHSQSGDPVAPTGITPAESACSLHQNQL